jgi:type II secretory pathway pseudopilin PulG
MALTNFEEDQFEQDDLGGEVAPDPERKPSNRNFIIAIAVVGAIFILSLILLLLLGPGLLANQQAAQQEQAAQINAANTATAMAATALVQAQQATQLAKTVAPTKTPVIPTKTPVVVVQASTPGTGSGLSASELATVSALQTQMAGTGGGATPGPTSTALPTSGFADEVGLPMMAGLALVLVVVILLSRKLRLSH